MRKKPFKLRLLLPAIYLVVALGAWIDFMRLPPDGLANLGIMLVIWPAALLDLALRPANESGRSMLIPERWGYYGDQSAFYWASVIVLAAGLYLIGRAVDRRFARGSVDPRAQ